MDGHTLWMWLTYLLTLRVPTGAYAGARLLTVAWAKGEGWSVPQVPLELHPSIVVRGVDWN
jgi:hypothetical protein